MQSLPLGAIHARLKASCPLVQNITNTVVQQFSANALLAMGASPAMIDHEADAAEFVRLADALLVNFGTASNQQLLAADAAIDCATHTGTPWVLDPVSVGAVAFRSVKIRQALNACPNVVRGNASEIMALAQMGQGGRGVDSLDEVDQALPAAIALAQKTQGVVAVSGAVDAIVCVADGTAYIARVVGGHELMSRVVGTGCSLGGAVAAYLGALAAVSDTTVFYTMEDNPAIDNALDDALNDPHGDDTFDGNHNAAHDEKMHSQQRPLSAPVADDVASVSHTLRNNWAATVAAHAHFSWAGRRAFETAKAPGSFAIAFIDALYTMTSADLCDTAIQVSAQPLLQQ